MKILEIKDIEDCFDGTFIKEALLDRELDESFVLGLEKFGELQYFPQFAKPFFRLNVNGKYLCKGVIGNKNIRLILDRKNLDESLESFLSLIKNVTVELNSKKE